MPKIIAFYGPIGSGKTTRAKMLSHFMGVPLFSEIADSPFLKDMLLFRKNALLNQLHFLYRDKNQVLESIDNKISEVLIFDYYIAQVDVFSKCYLKRHEYELFSEHYKKVLRQIPKPNLIIYLSVDQETNRTRIKSRDIKHEREINRKDISLMHAYTKSTLAHIKRNANIMELDASEDIMFSLTSRLKVLEIMAYRAMLL